MKSILIEFVSKHSKRFLNINKKFTFLEKSKLIKTSFLFSFYFTLNILSHFSYANTPSTYGPCINKGRFIECHLPHKEVDFLWKLNYEPSDLFNNNKEVATIIAKNTVAGIEHILNDVAASNHDIGIIINTSQINNLKSINDTIEDKLKDFNEALRSLRDIYGNEEHHWKDMFPDAFIIHVGFKGLNNILNSASKKFRMLPQGTSWHIGFVFMPTIKVTIAKNDMEFNEIRYRRGQIISVDHSFTSNWILWANLDFGIDITPQNSKARFGISAIWNLNDTMTTAKDFAWLGGAGGSFSIEWTWLRNTISLLTQKLTHTPVKANVSPSNIKFGGLYSLLGDSSSPVIPEFVYFSVGWTIFERGLPKPTEFPAHFNVTAVLPLFDLLGKAIRLGINKYKNFLFSADSKIELDEEGIKAIADSLSQYMGHSENQAGPSSGLAINNSTMEIIERKSPIVEEPPPKPSGVNLNPQNQNTLRPPSSSGN